VREKKQVSVQHKGTKAHAYAAPDYGKEGVIKQGVICHDIPFQRSPFHPENVRALKMLYNSFKNERFCFIHVHTPVASVLGRLAAYIAGIPCVMYTAHGFHFFLEHRFKTGFCIILWNDGRRDGPTT